MGLAVEAAAAVVKDLWPVLRRFFIYIITTILYKMLRGVDSVQMASPAIDENIELSNRPINYLKGRIKALVK
jgi:hypothetical protein